MAPRRRFDKKNATTFNIVHRAHDDSRFYDDEASEHVLVRTNAPSKSGTTTKKIYTTTELEQKLNKDQVRDNEGMAAQYGIFYDDSKYDYMQHLKPIGTSQDGVFISAKTNDKPKETKIEDLFKDQLPSESKRKIGADLNESVPKELKGFNPNLDPRLREVLEALEDEAYITDDDEGEEGGDVFNDLLKSGEVEDEDEFYYGSDAEDYQDDDYDEWDLDNYQDEYDQKYEQGVPEDDDYKNYEENDHIPDANVNSGWQKDFMKFKRDTKNQTNDWDSDDDFEGEEEGHEEEEADELPELPQINGASSKKKSKTKLRKKKGAMTDTSSFSMSSSALFRTEGLTLLDDRYEQLNKKFEEDEEEQEEYKPFNMKEERNDFEDMLDDFLDNYELESGGRKLVKKDEERKKLQNAAKSMTRGKLGTKSLNGAFDNLKI
ncbi:LTV1 [[Candida] subhashii]|uniref:LTV1 n=1 Tax=[Candida] subhashii TaxID=561895 RepID=A0A8J5V0G5_9ASCO|nr:LTV1 [[Candida] subhashii]KAG7663859.1 LTV1 [[Candida] subhashii]